MKLLPHLFLSLFMLQLLSACNQGPGNATEESAGSGVSIAAEEQTTEVLQERRSAEPETDNPGPPPKDVLAYVGDDYVTESDLQRSVLMTLPRELRSLAMRQAKDAMLKATISRKALAQIAEDELTTEEIHQIDQIAKAYREQLLSNAMAHKKGGVEEINESDLKDYYDNHPELWRGEITANYELLWVDPDLPGQLRTQAAKRLQPLRSMQDWAAPVRKGSEIVKDLKYWRGQSSLSALEPKLAELLQATQVGSTSLPTWVDSRLYLARVHKRDESNRKTLNQVRESITKTLRAERVREALRALTDSAMEKVRVRYVAADNSVSSGEVN